MDDWKSKQEISDKVRVVCYAYDCIYNSHKKCRRIEIELTIENNIPTCSGYETL